jgi:hypothetical protein
VNITPTPVTAALAGVFSAAIWPYFWSRYGSSTTSDSIELVTATLLVIALPAHALVIGFRPAKTSGTSRIDTALLKRIGAWFGAAAATAVIGMAVRA